MKATRILFTIFLLVSCAAAAGAQGGRERGNRARNITADCPRLSALAATEPLSAEEASLLLFMREEEKLARDVYQYLSQKWQIRIFNNIAASEQRHFNAIGTLITRYELDDAAKPAAGEFTNPELQQLYYDLTARGTASLVEAMKVGVLIEEKDIEDLQEAIGKTDNKDILVVYGNLLNGSLNHLSAFQSHLDALGAN